MKLSQKMPLYFFYTMVQKGRVIFFVSRRATHVCLDFASNAALGGRVWVKKYRRHFAQNLVSKRSKGYNCLTLRFINCKEQVRRGLFADHNLFAMSVFFFSTFLIATAEADQLYWETHSRTVGRQWKEGSQKHGVEDNVSCSTSYHDGCRLDGRKWMPRVNSEIRESKVDNLRRKGKDLIPYRTFCTMRMIRHRTFPFKDESTNGGRGYKTTKKRKKPADATASTQTFPLRWCDCVWRRVLAIFSASSCIIWKNAAASRQNRHSWNNWTGQLFDGVVKLQA